MEQSLDALASGGPVPDLDGSPSGIVLRGRLSSDLRAHYYEVPSELDARVRAFVASARELATALEAPPPGGSPPVAGPPSSPAAAEPPPAGPGAVEAARMDALVSEAEGPLLEVLDEAVNLRQRQQVNTLRDLQFVSVAAFGVLALALVLLVHGRSRRQARDASAHARQAEAERFQFLVQGSSDVILVMDDDTTIRYVSPAAERLFGYPEAELVGTPAIALIHPDELARAADTMEVVLSRSGARVETTSWRIRRADGSCGGHRDELQQPHRRSPRRGDRAQHPRRDPHPRRGTGPGRGARLHRGGGQHGGGPRRRDHP